MPSDDGRLVIVLFGRLAEGTPRWLARDDQFSFHRYTWSILDTGTEFLPDKPSTVISGSIPDPAIDLDLPRAAQRYATRTGAEYLVSKTWHSVADQTRHATLCHAYKKNLLSRMPRSMDLMARIINKLVTDGPMTTTEIREAVGAGRSIAKMMIRACKSKNSPIQSRPLTDELRKTHNAHSRAKHIYRVKSGTKPMPIAERVCARSDGATNTNNALNPRIKPGRIRSAMNETQTQNRELP